MSRRERCLDKHPRAVFLASYRGAGVVWVLGGLGALAAVWRVGCGEGWLASGVRGLGGWARGVRELRLAPQCGIGCVGCTERHIGSVAAAAGGSGGSLGL
ncbi:hypothetical protein GCM10027360_04020 [Amycolatopsis echigonensis]